MKQSELIERLLEVVKEQQKIIEMLSAALGVEKNKSVSYTPYINPMPNLTPNTPQWWYTTCENKPHFLTGTTLANNNRLQEAVHTV